MAMYYLHETGQPPEKDEFNSRDMQWIRILVGHVIIKGIERPRCGTFEKTEEQG